LQTRALEAASSSHGYFISEDASIDFSVAQRLKLRRLKIFFEQFKQRSSLKFTASNARLQDILAFRNANGNQWILDSISLTCLAKKLYTKIVRHAYSFAPWLAFSSLKRVEHTRFKLEKLRAKEHWLFT
jgi:hypothetical protein